MLGCKVKFFTLGDKISVIHRRVCTHILAVSVFLTTRGIACGTSAVTVNRFVVQCQICVESYLPVRCGLHSSELFLQLLWSASCYVSVQQWYIRGQSTQQRFEIQ
jgi:hypothetical protein